MSKKIITAFLGTFFLFNIAVLSCNGQAALLVLLLGDKVASEKFHLSIDGGLNVMPDKDHNYYPYFGLGTHLKINDQLAFVSGFKPLSQRSVSVSSQLVTLPTDINLKDVKVKILPKYVDIPVMVNYKITQKLFLNAGVQIGVCYDATQELTAKTSTGEDVTVNKKVKSYINPVSYNIPIQIGYSVPTFRHGKGVNVILGYNYGINAVFKNKAYGSSIASFCQLMLSFPFINVDAKN